jgi:hypothetical protein
VFALAVQNSAYGVNSSALADTSGTSRHGVPGLASEHVPVTVPGLLTSAPVW